MFYFDKKVWSGDNLTVNYWLNVRSSIAQCAPLNSWCEQKYFSRGNQLQWRYFTRCLYDQILAGLCTRGGEGNFENSTFMHHKKRSRALILLFIKQKCLFISLAIICSPCWCISILAAINSLWFEKLVIWVKCSSFFLLGQWFFICFQKWETLLSSLVVQQSAAFQSWS